MSDAEGRIFDSTLLQKPLVLRRSVRIMDQGSRSSPNVEMLYDCEHSASPRFVGLRSYGLYQKVILPPFSSAGAMATDNSQLAHFSDNWSMRPMVDNVYSRWRSLYLKTLITLL